MKDYVTARERLARLGRPLFAELRTAAPWPVLFGAVILAALIAISLLAESAAHWRERALEEGARAERCEALGKLPAPARLVRFDGVSDAAPQ